MTERRPPTMPLDPPRGDVGRLRDEPGRSARRVDPGDVAESVRTGPGESDVHDTPVPESSACSASENECTNAFVAA